MEDIFENAYFGKAYKTRNEWKAIYIDCEDNDFNSHPHRLFIENPKMFVFYNDFGTALSSPEDDIVSEWQEPIDEEKLDKLAKEFADKYSYPHTEQNANLQCGFKAGCRKAIMEK